MIDLTTYIPVILSVLVGVLIVLVVLAWRLAVQWAKVGAVNAENEAWSQVQYIVGRAVVAANQILSGSSGEEKLKYVLGIVDRLFPDLDEEVVRAIVEASVRETKTKEAV